MICLTALYPYTEITEKFPYAFSLSEIGGYRVLEAPETEVTVTHHRDRKLDISAEGTVILQMPCDRCLTDTAVSVSWAFNRKIDTTLLKDEEGDEIGYIHDDMLDPDPVVSSEVMMNLPMKVLCREDCRGICLKCGANLNSEACSCTKEPAPGSFADLLKDFKLS